MHDGYLKTRKCHNCDRHSWLVAEGKPCPHCGRITGKYHNEVYFGFMWVAVLATAAAIAVIIRMIP
jgi:hypothetical protein